MKITKHSIATICVIGLWTLGLAAVIAMMVFLVTYALDPVNMLPEINDLAVIGLSFAIIVWVAVYAATRVVYGIELLLEG